MMTNNGRFPQLHDSDFAHETTGLVHRLRQPEGDGPHPTVVMLQGRAGNEDVMWVFARTVPANWLLVAPRAIYDDPDEGGYSWHLPVSSGWPPLATFAEAVGRVTRLVEALPELYGADPDQIYLMGFSQGVALSLALALDEPGRYRGVAGLVGFMPTTSPSLLATAPLLHLPVLLLAGTQDERIPIAKAQETATAVRAAGAYLEYREYDTGHKLNGAGMRKLTNWWAEREAERSK
jgi:phospholipase/carboxylesterase